MINNSNIFELEVMSPPGHWKFFITYQFNYILISKYYDILTPQSKTQLTLTFDEDNKSLTTFDFNVNKFNNIKIDIDPIIDY